MSADTNLAAVAALSRIERLTYRRTRHPAHGQTGDIVELDAAIERARLRLVRLRAADAARNATRFARVIDARRACRSSRSTRAARTPRVEVPVAASSKPQLDPLVVGRHCRQVFPPMLLDDEFRGLLALLEAAERGEVQQREAPEKMQPIACPSAFHLEAVRALA